MRIGFKWFQQELNGVVSSEAKIYWVQFDKPNEFLLSESLFKNPEGCSI